MDTVLQWRFLIHLWTLAGLASAGIAAQRIVEGDLDSAARWLLLVLVVDHTDGTMARAFQVRRHIPRISGETLDLVTDLVGLTFVPMLFLWRAEAFLPGWGGPLAVAASVTASLKYSMKGSVLEEGFSRGAPPAFFAAMLFWLMGLPQGWATAFVAALVVLCWIPVRYPITSLVTTHWKPGLESVTNYLSFAAMVPALLWLRGTPSLVFWPVLVAVLFHLAAGPFLLITGVMRPGLRRTF